MALQRKTLDQLLVEKGILTTAQAEEAAKAQGDTGQSLEQVVVDLGFASEEEVMRARAEQLRVPYEDIADFVVPDTIAPLIPPDLQVKYNCIPLRLDGRRLTVGMINPKDLLALDDLRMRTGYEIHSVLVSQVQLSAKRDAMQPAAEAGAEGAGLSSIAGLLKEFEGTIDAEPQRRGLFGLGGSKQTTRAASASEEGTMSAGQETDVSTAQLKEMTEEAPIIKIASVIIQQAIMQGASDIHVEPQRRGMRVRYRVDGVLHETMKLPNYIMAPLVSRFKIMSDMNIAERRIPQDGRIFIRMNRKEYDMRVSDIPTVYGEKIVMRILDKSNVLIGLERLGLYPETQAVLMDLANQPNGMILSTGPTGHGKTTTQYSVLNLINSVDKNIITIEDPVEYQLAGLSQVHVNRKAGLTFANALRSFLRQDPDIIMVGEIRDLETAEIAIQASLTGHLVLSTLHTNDAASASTRLIDMGVEPFLVSATLVGILAQRLGRRICENCKEPFKPKRESLLRFGFDPDEHPEQLFYHGRGCDECRQTGYRGRLGIFELLKMNDDVGDLIVRRSPLSEIREAARVNGMKLLREDGFRKVCDGVTTVDEVMRVVFTAGG